jgi:hypothetical protein
MEYGFRALSVSGNKVCSNIVRLLHSLTSDPATSRQVPGMICELTFLTTSLIVWSTLIRGASEAERGQDLETSD